MYKELFKRNSLQIVAFLLVLCITCPIFALDHFWTGSVSTDAADPRNWDNGSANPTLPSAGDIVRIGCTSAWADYVSVNQPVLTSEWNGRNGGPSAGWWFVLGVGNQNTLTIGDGAYIEFSKNDCNLRNGGILHVTGQRTGGGPSIVIPPRFRIGNVGDSVPGSTGTITIDDDGYLRFDPSIAAGGSGGTEIYMGSAANALIEIRDDGILETVNGTDIDDEVIVTPQFVFASSDPAVNKIVISGNGRLILAGDPPVALVDNLERSIKDLINIGLITTDEPEGILTISGVNPTVVALVERRSSNPSPTDGNPDVAKPVVLSWDASQIAEKHDVYFGADFDAVSNADRTNPLDVLKSQDQVETYYPLTGTLSLDFGQTYYWRVDEVNDLSEQPISKGDVWSFTVEPLAYSLSGRNIIATASSQVDNQGPEKTIDGSGLVGDLHSTALEDMWLSDVSDSGSAWIQYEFDITYRLYQMMVWNYNGDFLLSGSGMKDVTVEYSVDGANWTQLEGVTQFPKAPGAAEYASDITVDFDEVAAKFVRITATSNWAGFTSQFGLSEVRFTYIPVSARMPSPDEGATDVPIDVTLGWRAGREAAEHNVYISQDQQAVIDGTAPVVTVNQSSYGPLSLDLGDIYYWRVDEVNNNNSIPVWEGNTWSFTTSEYLVVDDFESYNDIAEGEEGSNLVYQTWIDGYDSPSTNGSTVGYTEAFRPSMETTIIHGGRQSVPISYDNSVASISEITANTNDLAVGRDWTVGSPEKLTLWFYGDPNNSTTDRMYIKVNDVKVICDGDLTQAEWQEFTVDLASLGIDLSNVSSLIIGFERTGATGGSGIVFIDDIMLYRPAAAQ